MARMSMKRIVGNNEDEEKGSLLSSTIKATKSKPSRKTLWTFAALVVVLQGLVAFKWFFFNREVYITLPYNVTETTGLVTAYYELLRDMRYLGRDSIAYPPHVGHNAINHTLVIDILGLDERVFETLQQLPYVIAHDDQADNSKSDAAWPGWMGQERTILWRNGHFADYRSDEMLYRSRDPLGRWQITSSSGIPFETAMSDFEALPKSAIPLSYIRYRKYGLVLVLDTASNRIVVLDTQGSGGMDPIFAHYKRQDWPLQYKIHKSTFYGEELHARFAPDVLREFIHLTSHLEPGFIPGSVRNDEVYTPELSPPKWERWVKDLYREYAWPSAETLEECQFLSLRRNNTCDHDPMKQFRGEAFSKAMAALRHNITIKYLGDWYCPVPREKDIIDTMKPSGLLTEEQIAYAESDEPIIPLNLEGWGRNLVFMQSED